MTASPKLSQPDYNSYARFYDYFELAGRKESEELNIFIDKLFSMNDINTVLDLACGTGAQAVGLARCGYKVTATDLSEEMIKYAKQKTGKLKINFSKGDMRAISVDIGEFDAAICIFNAIGHLTPSECKKFFREVFCHIKIGGLFIVDILNFSAMLGSVFLEYRNSKRDAIIDGMLVQQARTCDFLHDKRQLEIRSLTIIQDGKQKPKNLKDCWRMQLYDSKEMILMLKKAGFSEIQLFGMDGTEFDDNKSDNIMAVCQK